MEQAGKLLNQYSALYRDKYGSAPRMNRFKEKYGMKDVVESVGFDRATEIMSYYFKTGRTSHPVEWFKYNFDKLDKVMVEKADDEEWKQKKRAETKARVEEWERKHGESRSETD